MNDGIATFLFTQGVLGVACLVLGIVCVKLYNKNERLEKENPTFKKLGGLKPKIQPVRLLRYCKKMHRIWNCYRLKLR